MSIFLLQLILAHLLGDFIFQSRKMVESKKIHRHRSPTFYLHLVIHLVFLLILLKFDFQYWIGIAAIVLSHGCIDILKLKFEERVSVSKTFLFDQAAHILVLLIVAYAYFPFQLSIDQLYDPKLMLFLTAIILVTYVAAIFMRHIMSSWRVEEDREQDSLPYAGKYIGILERLFVFGFILIQQWEAIGLLIAAKSIFRFSDLSRAKDRKLTEYVLIGTFLSFGIAFVIGVGYILLEGWL